MNNNTIETSNRVITESQLDDIIGAILDGKYSWACLLILKFVGLQPNCFIPYGTYNRLIKENRKIESKRSALEKQYQEENESQKHSLALASKIQAALKKSKQITASNLSRKTSIQQNKKDREIKVINKCNCDKCQYSNDCKTQELHGQMNLFLSRLNEQQRRWYVALEAKKMGHGGIKVMSEITGMHSDTIRRGARELETCLNDRPSGRVRKAGGGRKKAKKKRSDCK